MEAGVVVLETRDGVVVVVVTVGDGVDVVVVTVTGDGVVVVVVMAGEGVVVVVVIVISPSFSRISRLLPTSLACLVAGMSCPPELEDGVLAISVKMNEQEEDRH